MTYDSLGGNPAKEISSKEVIRYLDCAQPACALSAVDGQSISCLEIA
ncbi:MAG: hypothetical protein HC780_18060 [Leptolyngbyaceae cyanobacterium CSU_1_3]|nr:hypothetical protein [Leptolyngbyaceae cyanobacterium CSU_1_3]